MKRFKRVLLIALCFILTISFTACGNGPTNDPEEKEPVESKKTVELKEPVEYEYFMGGNYVISIDGAEWSGWGKHIDGIKGKDLLLINITFENKSIEQGQQFGEGDFTDDEFFTVKDEEGFVLECYSSAWESISDYEAHAGLFTVKKGEKKRLAFPYLLNKNAKYVTVEMEGVEPIKINLK